MKIWKIFSDFCKNSQLMDCQLLDVLYLKKFEVPIVCPICPTLSTTPEKIKRRKFSSKRVDLFGLRSSSVQSRSLSSEKSAEARFSVSLQPSSVYLFLIIHFSNTKSNHSTDRSWKSLDAFRNDLKRIGLAHVVTYVKYTH